MNICLSSYLTKKRDPQRGIQWPSNDDAIVKTWINSVEHCGLHGIIFDDNLTAEFVSRWEGAVEFCRSEWSRDDWNCTEERFVLYRDYLFDMDADSIGKVVCTDLSDVEFYGSPFRLMTDPDAIYIGSEPTRIAHQKCVTNWMQAAYGEVTDADKPILNPGILGGSYQTVLSFLNRLIAEMERGKAGSPGLDLCAFNRLVYRSGIKYVTGAPLHTQFRRNEDADSGCAIKHK